MRHGAAGRRSRNRGNNGGGNHHHRGGRGHGGGGQPNRMQVFDSNGPEVRIRGTAHQICEKYMALAKDAAASGDRVLSESYLQHAEHYQRLINSWGEDTYRPQYQQQQQAQPTQQGAEEAQEGDLALPASLVGARAPAAELETA